MIRVLIVIGLLLMSILSLHPQSARASGYDLKAGLMPAKYFGQWATPSCEAPSNVLTIYGHLVLDASAATNFTYRVTKTAMSDDLFIVRAANLNLFFQEYRDNQILIARLFDDEVNANAPVLPQIKERLKSYAQCENHSANADWPSLNPLALSAAPRLHELETACQGQYIEHSPSCQQAAFSFLDDDQDGLLNRVELERAYQLAVFFGGSISCFFPHHFTTAVKSDATIFAEETIASMDGNQDYKLSRDEITKNWGVATLQRPFTRFMEYTNDLAIILYMIPHYPYIER